MKKIIKEIMKKQKIIIGNEDNHKRNEEKTKRNRK